MADVKILLDTLLRPNTFSTRLLLEYVKTSQILQEKSSAREWIGKANTLLNSRQDRWMGICLLDPLLDQCDTELFIENCLSWLKTITQILQQEDTSSYKKFVVEVLEKILSFSVQFSEIARQISLTIIPSLLTAMLREKNTINEISLLVIKTCIDFFPGASGQFIKPIQSRILEVFRTDNYFLIQVACSCFAVLPKCGGDSDTGSDKQSASWEIQFKKLLSNLYYYVNELLVPQFQNIGEPFFSGSVSSVEPQRTETCVLRITLTLKCLNSMLSTEFPKSINIPLNDIRKIVQLIILSVNEKSLKSKVTLESVLLKSSICALHYSTLEFLSTLIISCGRNVLPYYNLFIELLEVELLWTKCDEGIHGFQKKYSELRSAVYDCFQNLVYVTSSVGSDIEGISRLIQHILQDIKPNVTTTKLLASSVSTTKTSHGRKGNKRKGIQDDVSQLHRTEQKTDFHANKDLCLSGLKALNVLILHGHSDIYSADIKQIQEFVVKLLLECQKMAPSQSNYPIPYGSSECRKMLFNLLKTLLYNNKPGCLPPLQQAIVIFSRGVQDHDLEVSKLCTEAQMICHLLVHPRVAIISSTQSSHEPRTSDTMANEERRSEDASPQSINDDDNRLQDCQPNTSELGEETEQNEQITPEVAENENEFVHEEMEQTITEHENNVKRRLPEGFQEISRFSKDSSQDSTPGKRRKTQNVINEGFSEVDSMVEKRHTAQDVITTDKQSPPKHEKEILQLPEDERLVNEMIDSFVDSGPDSPDES